MTPMLARRATSLSRTLILWSAVIAFTAEIPRLSAAASLTADEWPEFRGPDGQGHSAATNLPLEWSTEKNVLWKTSIPGEGWSSPVASRGQVFLTTGVPGSGAGPSLRALALDAATGRVLWNTEVFANAESS